MKSTQDIIEELKRIEYTNYSHYSAPKPCTKDARNRLEEMQREIDRLRYHIGERTDMLRPEPSRLEIAAMLGSGMNPAWSFNVQYLLDRADMLIAGAKETR
jgi:hypothetical protein